SVRRALLASHGHLGHARLDHEETEAGRAFPGYDVPGWKGMLGEDRNEQLELLVGERGEHWDSLQRFGGKRNPERLRGRAPHRGLDPHNGEGPLPRPLA